MAVDLSLSNAGYLQSALTLCTVLALAFCFKIIFDSRRAGLSGIPGPLLARYTDAWALYTAWQATRGGDKVEYYRGLLAQYGDVIRTGPRSITVFDPAAVPVIYGVRSKLNKVRNATKSHICEVVRNNNADSCQIARAMPMYLFGSLA
jgi:hypothetical protein